MSKSTKLQKVAILGGGMGGLTTAYAMTSQPGWQDRFDITIYQLGWRLGGKCASSRGENGRIEEHGIHGFVGSYFNALPMMNEVYAELGRKPGQPLATFDEAFIPSNFAVMWEFRDGGLKPWATRFPENNHSAIDPSDYKGLQSSIDAIIYEVGQLLGSAKGVPKLVEVAIEMLLAKAREQCRDIPMSEGPDHPLVGEITKARTFISGIVETIDKLAPAIADHADALRHALFTLDFYATLIVGALSDNVEVNGYDGLDDENWTDWLIRHGIHAETLKSPVVMITVNICYQSPNGDTSRAARMAAGAFLDWTLRVSAYRQAFLWSFAAGTGETVVAPLYEVLKRRGVKFEFFHKVDALHIDPKDRRSIESVEFTLQATLKDPARGYEPLIEVKGLPSWPHRPLYEQLVEGEYMRTLNQDLESYWCPWPTAEFPHLKAPKVLRRGKVVATFALGSQRLYDFLHENSVVDFTPVDWVNDPRVIAREPNFVAINATTEVDFYGQCASETVAGHYFSSSGGQYDFSRGAMYSEGGQGFIVLNASTRDGGMSKIRPMLTPGSVVTTSKNTVDKIVTEFGVAELRGKTLQQRAQALIAIADPRFRDELSAAARQMALI